MVSLYETYESLRYKNVVKFQTGLLGCIDIVGIRIVLLVIL